MPFENEKEFESYIRSLIRKNILPKDDSIIFAFVGVRADGNVARQSPTIQILFTRMRTNLCLTCCWCCQRCQPPQYNSSKGNQLAS
jgi:hypothetical protein